MRVILPIGISGSGKSTLYKNEYSNCKIVCPDQIRLELTGDISNQSKNKEVFEVANERLEEYIKQNVDVFFDATNVNTIYRKEFVKKLKQHDNVKVVYVYLPGDIMESYRRIQKDLENNVVRSKVNLDVLYKQYNLYRKSLEQDWKEEGADEAIYLN